MDNINSLCQVECPSGNNLFGEPYSKTCVTACNNTGMIIPLYADSLSRKCVLTCTGNQYADPKTLKCVSSTGCYNGTNSDPYLKQCVKRCYNETFAYNGICYSTRPSTTLFADEYSQSYVTALNCAGGLFADTSKGKCVSFCDISSNAFADLSSHSCITPCLSPLYADNITRTCATKCTSIPQYYGLNTSRFCVQNCPNDTYGDPTVNLCVVICANGYYGDKSTWTCVRNCPLNTFGLNTSNVCVTTCPSSSLFGDIFTGTCV